MHAYPREEVGVLGVNSALAWKLGLIRGSMDEHSSKIMRDRRFVYMRDMK